MVQILAHFNVNLCAALGSWSSLFSSSTPHRSTPILFTLHGPVQSGLLQPDLGQSCLDFQSLSWTQNHVGPRDCLGTPLGMSVREFPERKINLNMGSTISWAGDPDVMKEEEVSWADTFASQPAAQELSCTALPPPCQDRLNVPKLWPQRNLPP